MSSDGILKLNRTYFICRNAEPMQFLGKIINTIERMGELDKNIFSSVFQEVNKKYLERFNPLFDKINSYNFYYEIDIYNCAIKYRDHGREDFYKGSIIDLFEREAEKQQRYYSRFEEYKSFVMTDEQKNNYIDLLKNFRLRE